MISVYLNDRIKDLKRNVSIGEILDDLGYKHNEVAVEVNKVIIPKSEYKNKSLLNQHDRINIVEFIGGG